MAAKYIVSLWPDCGYHCQDINVTAYDEEEALEAALAYCQANKLKGLYIDVDDIDDNLTDDEKEDLYIYIDPTFGRPGTHPAYLYAENLRIRKIA